MAERKHNERIFSKNCIRSDYFLRFIQLNTGDKKYQLTFSFRIISYNECLTQRSI